MRLLPICYKLLAISYHLRATGCSLQTLAYVLLADGVQLAVCEQVLALSFSMIFQPELHRVIVVFASSR